MRNLFLFTLLFLLTNLVGAQTYTTIASGQWDNTATWDANGAPPEPIPPGSTVNINHSVSTFFVSTITNNGTININGTGGITLQGSTQAVNNGSVISTSTTFGSALGVSTGTSFTNNGYYQADGTGTQSSSIRMLGGTFTNANGGTLDLSGALVSFQSNSTLFFNEDGGTVDISGNSQFNILALSSFVPDPTAVVWINAGTFNLIGPDYPFLYLQGGTKNNLSTGVINVYDGSLSIDNTLNNEGAINFLAADASGQIYGTVNSTTGTIDMTAGTINASGTVAIPTLTNDATLIPSFPDRTFDITGNYDGSGTLRSIILSTNPDEYGSIIATGTAGLTAQTLSVAYSGFTPAIGDAFTVVTAAGGVTGPFQSTQLPGLPSDREWRIDYNPTAAVLRVVAVSADQDGDGIADNQDNCPSIANADQANNDGDSEGDVCDEDDDNDGVLDVNDNCPFTANADQANNDGDSEGDVCDEDDDNDGVLDVNDNCPLTANADQADLDHDGQGDACDPDVCINGVVNYLVGYVEGLGIRSTVERAITRRLELAATRFCSGSSTSTVITSLNSAISYLQTQSGRGIPSDAADHVIAQVNALIDALNQGIVVCCIPRPAPPTAPGQVAAEQYQLEANPNPFSGQQTIRFYLPEAGPATLEVFNLNGQRVAALHSGYLDAGQHDYSWNGADDAGQQLSSGIYLIRLRTEEGTLVQKVSLVR